MLAKGDVLKFDELLNKNIVWFLNMVAYFKDKAQEEKEILDHAKRKNRF
jgi:hypothetical protein